MSPIEDVHTKTQPLVVPSVVDVLYEALRADILRGDVAAGSLMTEVGVGAKYLVARPSAKAALERLAQDGLVRRDSNKSARVPWLSADDVRDLYKELEA